MRNVIPTILLLLVVLGGASCSSQTEGDKAQGVLTHYLSLLHKGKYVEAAKLYGGEYEVLAEWNPTIDPNDHAKLLELGCTINGLQCLPIKTIGAREDSVPGTFEFYVRFENPDGSVFVLESSDASTTGQLFETDIKFTVMKRGDDFVVRELPIYVP
jgi:hypothetical protein